MLRRRPTARQGITLTEILISILIMGVGMVSVATLFPLGLMRMRQAARDSRSTLLAQSAADELNGRRLLAAQSFMNLPAPYNWYSAWAPFGSPFVKDLNTLTGEGANQGAFRGPMAPGLPVCYDPLFWSVVHYNAAQDGGAGTPGDLHDLARFGLGTGLIRGSPAADGLQRITNFAPFDLTVPWTLTYDLTGADGDNAEVAGSIFASQDDPVVVDPGADDSQSPLVPFAFPGLGYQQDWNFTYLVTGRQSSAGDSSFYEADIVVFDKRPIGMTQVNTIYPDAGSRLAPDGERVVEAIWGYTSSMTGVGLIEPGNDARGGYSTADDRSVLLRWDARLPDPDIRVGTWIADVTYDRYASTTIARFGDGLYSGQRCHWYRISQIGRVENDPVLDPLHKRIVVRVETPLKAKTRLAGPEDGAAESMFPEAALIAPYAVNVFGTLLFSR